MNTKLLFLKVKYKGRRMNLLEYVSEIVTLIVAIIGVVISLKGLMKNSLSNKIRRYDHLVNIFSMRKTDKVLSITGLKDYLEVSVTLPFYNFIMDSEDFYEITNVLKSCFSYIEFDEITESIKLKEDKRPRKWNYILLYILFCIPVLLLQFLINESSANNFSVLLLMSPFIYGAFQMAMVISNRTRAINLANKYKSNQRDEKIHRTTA